TGGPGAIFWLIFAGFCGMSMKFTECTLGQRFREVDSAGKVSGGPMRYLFKGLHQKGLGGLGRVLALLFAVLCIGGSLGGGNTFQVV
ncbi:MAG: alanine:cation symporter family protein, partial [Planctomycetota bacterium]|nr:alanine:cation symporter family protein [Planctomycetota bacterium]